MNKLLIPPSPNWYETDIIACAPDNTVMYGSRQDLIVIKTVSGNEPDDVQVITKAHSMRIKSVNINRNWGQPHKYAVTVSEDKIVKLWDIESLEKKLSHNAHILQDDDTKIVGASFGGDDRVISTSESGTVVIWNITKNETNVLNSMFDGRTIVTCLSVCPHATWLAAFGLKSGLIVVADLRKTGKILYKLRGHDKAVVSLSWCPAPINIFPLKPNNKVVEKPLEEVSESLKLDKQVSDVSEDINDDGKETVSSIQERLNNEKETTKYTKSESSENIKEETADRRKQKCPKKASNPWVGLVHADDDCRVIVEKPTEESDFLKECADLKKDILHMSTPKSENKVGERATEQESQSAQKIAVRPVLKPRTRSLNSKIPELLLKQQALQKGAETFQKDLDENEALETKKVDTPTDRGELDMEVSDSVKKLHPKLTDISVKSMEMTMCERKLSTNTADTTVSDIDKRDISVAEVGVSQSDITTSSEESKQFSSVSSCDNDCNCTKHTGALEKEDIKKSDTSTASESGEVFHDAQICEKEDKNGVICIAEDSAHFEEEPRKEFLLASSAREPNIYIWRAGTDGRMQSFMMVPPAKNQKKSRPDKIWITICWVAPNILLSSSRSAELLQWTLPKPMVKAKYVRQVHKDHWSVLFSIKAPILYLNEHNFLQERDVNAWTTGMDRILLNTEIGSQKNLGCYYALGGSVNCFSGSPLDPNRLAFGTGEGVLNVWDLSREHKKRIVFSTFYQKIMASVTALAWHPRIETALAFGTVEGRIGVLDTGAKSRTPKILTHYFKSQIYKIEWGPLNGDVQNPGLFVVGEAKVVIFEPKSPEKEPQLLEMPDNTSVYTMSWKPDYSLFLVSSKSGSLITYTPDLTISNVSYVRHKLESIVWNPNAASNDQSVSKYCRTFASIVKRNELFVCDLSVQGELNEDNVIARFENRGVLINSIEWNPHLGNQLVFVDDGGVAQVYDVETKTVLSTYVNPCLDTFLSTYWSPVDPDYIITGTVGHKIIVWKVSENAPLTDKEINSMRNKITRAQSKEVSNQLLKKLEITSTDETEVAKVKKATKSSILPVFCSFRENSKIQDIKKLLRWKLGDETVESNIGDSKNIDVLEIFDDKNNMERVLELNIAAFRQKGQHHNGNLLTLFKGDIGAAVKEAIEEKRVTPWIISMCPMVDPKLWQTACATYANQLQEEAEADPLEIVTYLLACHKVEESVDILCEKEMFREALALAKSRFGANNSVISEIKDKWARHLVYQGNFEIAAQCYISIGKFEEAASALFRRSNVELLEVAVELAQLSKNEELYKAVLFRFNAFKTVEDKSKASSKTIDQTNKEIHQDHSKEVVPEIEGVDSDSQDKKDNEKVIIVRKGNVNKDINEYMEAQEKLTKKIKEMSSENDCELKVVEQNEGLDKDLDSNKQSVIEKEGPEKEELELKSAELNDIVKEKAKESLEGDFTSEPNDLDKNDVEGKSEDSNKAQNKEKRAELNNKVIGINNKAILEEKSEPGDSKKSEIDDSEVLKKEADDLIEEEHFVSNHNGTTNDDEFFKQVKESISDSLKDKAAKLEEDAERLLDSQRGLLSTDEVKELLAKRKNSLEGSACVKGEE